MLVELEHRLAFVHVGAFHVQPGEQETFNLRASVRTAISGRGSDPFLIDGHLLFDHRSDGNCRWRGGGTSFSEQPTKTTTTNIINRGSGAVGIRHFRAIVMRFSPSHGRVPR